jgi:ABC-type tungstate transport system permease subunit
MYNDFVIVGPADDPAEIASASDAAQAFTRIAEAEATFVSRGDDSGTHSKEKSIWEAAGLEPNPDSGWYRSIGQGMGETLQMANESLGYTLADRGTYLSMSGDLTGLTVLFGGNSVAERYRICNAGHPGEPERSLGQQQAGGRVRRLARLAEQAQIGELGVKLRSAALQRAPRMAAAGIAWAAEDHGRVLGRSS